MTIDRSDIPPPTQLFDPPPRTFADPEIQAKAKESYRTHSRAWDKAAEATDTVVVNQHKIRTAVNATVNHLTVAQKAARATRAEKLAAAIGMAEETRTMAEIICIAYLDPADIYEPNGEAKPLDQIPEHARRAIAGVTRIYDKQGNAIATTYKLADKNAALEKVIKCLGMQAPEQVQVTDTVAAAILAARARRNAALKSVTAEVVTDAKALVDGPEVDPFAPEEDPFA
jgi:hypothetical protein